VRKPWHFVNVQFSHFRPYVTYQTANLNSEVHLGIEARDGLEACWGEVPLSISSPRRLSWEDRVGGWFYFPCSWSIARWNWRHAPGFCSRRRAWSVPVCSPVPHHRDDKEHAIAEEPYSSQRNPTWPGPRPNMTPTRHRRRATLCRSLLSADYLPLSRSWCRPRLIMSSSPLMQTSSAT